MPKDYEKLLKEKEIELNALSLGWSSYYNESVLFLKKWLPVLGGDKSESAQDRYNRLLAIQLILFSVDKTQPWYYFKGFDFAFISRERIREGAKKHLGSDAGRKRIDPFSDTLDPLPDTSPKALHQYRMAWAELLVADAQYGQIQRSVLISEEIKTKTKSKFETIEKGFLVAQDEPDSYELRDEMVDLILAMESRRGAEKGSRGGKIDVPLNDQFYMKEFESATPKYRAINIDCRNIRGRSVTAVPEDYYLNNLAEILTNTQQIQHDYQTTIFNWWFASTVSDQEALNQVEAAIKSAQEALSALKSEKESAGTSIEVMRKLKEQLDNIYQTVVAAHQSTLLWFFTGVESGLAKRLQGLIQSFTESEPAITIKPYIPKPGVTHFRPPRPPPGHFAASDKLEEEERASATRRLFPYGVIAGGKDVHPSVLPSSERDENQEPQDEERRPLLSLFQ